METTIITVAILEENNRFLITQKKDCEEQAFWEFPGGELQPREQPEQGLVRNIKEKIGMDITILDIFKVVFNICVNQQVIILAYLCVRNFGTPKSNGTTKFKWVTLDELRSGSYCFSEADKQIINKVSFFTGSGPSLFT